MTITVPRWSAVLLIAFVGGLGGLAIGQITQADSSGPPATASYTAPFEVTLNKVSRQLGSIQKALGTPTINHSILNLLNEVRGNTYGTCQAAGGSVWCHTPF